MIGQSIWNFIGERYGPSYISNILNLTRIIRNEERSISGTLGISFKSFLAEWSNYYLQQAAFVQQNYVQPSKDNRVFKNKNGLILNNAKISPEGNYLAYAINNRGKYQVIIQQLNRSKQRTVLKNGFKVLNQEFDKKTPLLSWKDESTLGIVGTKFGRNYLWIYDLSSKKRIKKELTRINQVRDFDIAKNANLAVLSADRDGDNDLYLISLRRNSIKRITNDLYDDINPYFIPGTSSIVFSSNRLTDSINVRNVKIEDINNNYNLFIYNIDSTKNTVYRLSNTISKDIKPMAVDDKDIFYLSDQQGIFNLYKYDLENGVYNQVSNFGQSIQQYSINSDKTKLAYIMQDDQHENLYLNASYNFDQNIFTAQTKRQQFLTAQAVAKRLRERKANPILSSKESNSDTTKTSNANQEGQAVESTAPVQSQGSFLDELRNKAKEKGPGYINPEDYQFEISPEQVAKETEKPKKEEKEKDIVDTDNYVFDTDVVKGGNENGSSFLSNYRRLRNTSDITGPLPYQTRFSADNVVTSFVIDPLIGFGIHLETQMTDQLENHKFYGGLTTTTDLKSGGFFGEYDYLKYTVDFHARYERKAIYQPTETASQKYTLNVWEAGASLPLNPTSRLDFSPFIATTHYYEIDPSKILYPPPGQTFLGDEVYGGFKFEFVFDDTNVSGLNMIQGTRGKVGIKHLEGLTDSQKSFSNFYVDLRNYQKIHRELVFATRLFYGRFFGQNKQTYMLGGMDNWLFNNTHYSGENDPLISHTGIDNSNILFSEYVTSLRGFDYNTFHGSNALLFNAELRFPVIKYFYRWPIASNFFKNLQFIGFYDIGSAWTGPSPFATENSLNTEVLRPSGSPFNAKIQNFKNPWLSSYGFGARTVLLGYFVKLDVAYPIEDYKRGKAKFLVTLGYDF